MKNDMHHLAGQWNKNIQTKQQKWQGIQAMWKLMRVILTIFNLTVMYPYQYHHLPVGRKNTREAYACSLSEL